MNSILYEGTMDGKTRYPFSMVGERNIDAAARQFIGLVNVFDPTGHFHVRVKSEEKWYKIFWNLHLERDYAVILDVDLPESSSR